MAAENLVLMIRHLPAELKSDDKEELLKHFGAEQVKCMGSRGSLKNVAFAAFPDKEKAAQALKRLHQIEILGSRLVVEFSKKQHRRFHPNLDVVKETDIKSDSSPQPGKPLVDLPNVELNVISSKWNLNYEFNPKLCYSYPAPTPTILMNISHTLAAVPKFYTQVLHLMNKMNLPVPFGPPSVAPPIQEDAYIPAARADPVMKEEPDEQDPDPMEIVSEEESEIESDEDKPVIKTLSNPKKRVLPGSGKSRKKPKLQNILASMTQPVAKSKSAKITTDVFEPVSANFGKQSMQNLGASITDLLEAKTNKESQKTLPSLPKEDLFASEEENSSGFGKIIPQKTEAVEEIPTEEEWKETEFITSRELKKGKLTSSQLKEFSVFKNYSPGDTTSRLYLKNLAKNVTDKDLHYIYGRYVDWSNEDEKLRFDIRLMKEGRMKGQAFITLPNDEAAEYAVRETNAYVLHTKPMVVQFARSAKPKDDATDKNKATTK